MDNTVLILGDSHLKRMGENFRFPDWFDVVGISGGKVQIWENFKDESRSNHILVIVAGGNNVTAKPWYPLQSKESLKTTMESFVELRNFCNFASTSLIICEVFNRKSSLESAFDPIRKLNGRLQNKTLKPNYRKFSFHPILSNDDVHLTSESYESACLDILEFVATPPLARPELANLSKQNVV